MPHARAFGRRAHLVAGENMVKIRLKNRNDNDRISSYLKNNWSGDFLISKGKCHSCDELQGLIAEGDYSINGICLYTIVDSELEVVLIESFEENKGIGSLLMKEIESIAIENEIKKIWIVTTNDNINAIRFYLKKGYSFRKISRNALENYRKVKPGIPLIGYYGIPIMDELEFEKTL
jgi:ribosomal protein S18 acetylase RimI-like enzyme